MTASIRTLPVSVVVVAGLLVGCPQKEDASGNSASAPSSSTSVKATSKDSAGDKPKGIEIDETVAKGIKSIVASCKVGKYADITACKNGEADDLVKYAREKKPAGYYASLAEIALTDGEKDETVFNAAIGVMGMTGWAGGVDWIRKNATPEAGARYVALVGKVTDLQYSNFELVGAAMPILGGKRKELAAALAKRKEGDDVRRSIYRNWLTWSGAAGLPDVQADLASTTNDDEKTAAVWSVGAALYDSPFGGERPKPSDEDRVKMCDWAKSLLDDANAATAGAAAGSAGRCKGAYIDAALDALEKRIKPGEFPEVMANSFRDQCWTEGLVGGTPNGTAEQCARTLSLLEKVAADKTLSANGAGNLVWTTSTVAQWTDAKNKKKGRDILSKLATNADKDVAKNARTELAKLK